MDAPESTRYTFYEVITVLIFFRNEITIANQSDLFSSGVLLEEK